jgi:hypothetical protein
MKRIIFGFILFTSHFYYSQNLIRTDIQEKKLDDFIKIENEIGSKLFKSDESNVSFKPVLQPIIFERKEKNIPNLLVFYTPYKDNSRIAEILYEWDVYNFDKGDNVKKSLAFNKAMIKKYYEIVDEISKKFGKSIQEGNMDNLSLLNSEGLKRSDEWRINDSLKVNSYIALSEYYEKNGMVTTAPTHRIRMYVTNEREEHEQNLTQEKIAMFHTFFLDFIAKLKASDYKGAENLFSDKIKDTVTEDALKKLLENTHFEKEIVLFTTGYQIVGDGNNYPMLQYKYSNDSEPPKEIIAVLFEDDGKIIGIRPLKKSE